MNKARFQNVFQTRKRNSRTRELCVPRANPGNLLPSASNWNTEASQSFERALPLHLTFANGIGISPLSAHCLYFTRLLELSMIYQAPPEGRKIATSALPSRSESAGTGRSPGSPHCWTLAWPVELLIIH